MTQTIDHFVMHEGVTVSDAALMLSLGHGSRFKAWDERRQRWAYPDELLQAFGKEIESFGDVSSPLGGFGYAITKDNLFLSSSGRLFTLVAGEKEDILKRYREKGFEGRRLGED